MTDPFTGSCLCGGARHLPALTVVLFAAGIALPCPARPDDGARYLESVPLGDGRVVVVAEGDLEPRSVGSYSIRVYGGANADHPYDDFIAGRVLPRNGTLAEVAVADIDAAPPAEVVIVSRSAGSGGYLTVHALDASGTSIRLVAECEGLPPDADVLAALPDCRGDSEPLDDS